MGFDARTGLGSRDGIPRRSAALRRTGRVCGLILGLVLIAGNHCAAQQANQSEPQQTPGTSTAAADPGPRRPWTNPSQLAVPGGQSGANFDAQNAARKKQLAEDTARLVELAKELKAEVDKTTKDTLSLTVIRKADEIEKLAHAVKEKMKQTSGAN